MVEIIKNFINLNSENRPNIVYKKNCITIHNTGNSAKGAGAKNHSNYLKSEGARKAKVSWHYTIDDKVIYQHLPENEMAYHTGNLSGNRHSIGIEICMNSDSDIYKATNNAIDLIVYICKRDNILYTLKQHYDWNKKNCPQLLRNNNPYSWEVFTRNVVNELVFTTRPQIESEEMYRVRTSFSNIKSQKGAFRNLENAKNLVDRLKLNENYYVFNSKGDKVYP